MWRMFYYREDKLNREDIVYDAEDTLFQMFSHCFLMSSHCYPMISIWRILYFKCSSLFMIWRILYFKCFSTVLTCPPMFFHCPPCLLMISIRRINFTYGGYFVKVIASNAEWGIYADIQMQMVWPAKLYNDFNEEDIFYDMEDIFISNVLPLSSHCPPLFMIRRIFYFKCSLIVLLCFLNVLHGFNEEDKL